MENPQGERTLDQEVEVTERLVLFAGAARAIAIKSYRTLPGPSFNVGICNNNSRKRTRCSHWLASLCLGARVECHAIDVANLDRVEQVPARLNLCSRQAIELSTGLIWLQLQFIARLPLYIRYQV